MAAKPLTAPFAIKNAVLSLAADDYTAHVTEATLTPTAGQTVMGIGGHKHRGAADWTLGLGLWQDDDAAGLSRYLFDHEGETVAFTLNPAGATGTSWAGSVVCSPTSIGGVAGTSDATTTVTLEVVGKPTPTDPEPEGE